MLKYSSEFKIFNRYTDRTHYVTTPKVSESLSHTAPPHRPQCLEEADLPLPLLRSSLLSGEGCSSSLGPSGASHLGSANV